MQPDAPDPQKIEKKQKITLKKLVLITLALLVLAAAGTLGYLYWVERQNNDRLTSQLDQAKTKQIPALRQSESTNKPVETTYTAAVGKFTLALPDMYYIIVDLDGGFEGGPATRLDIGTRNDTGNQTISSPHHARVSIAAYPINPSEGLSQRIAAGLAGYSQPGTPTTMKIAGVTAQVYQLPGLFSDKKIYFMKNDIVYEIVAGSSDVTGGMLNDVIKGFKLT